MHSFMSAMATFLVSVQVIDSQTSPRLGLLVLVLLPTPKHFKMPRLSCEHLFGLRSQAGCMLLLDLLLRDERGLLRLDDTRTALRSCL